MRISVIDTQEKILTKVLMLKGEKGDKGDPGELTNLDTELSTTSTNAVQNKVITKALNELLENSATNSFSDGIDSLFKKVVSSIVPVQAGSGTPSPTNVRAISGFTECVVKDNGKNFMPQKDVSVPDTEQSVAVAFDLPKGTYTISAKVSTDGSDTRCRYNIRVGTTAIAVGYLDVSEGRASSTFTIDYDCNRIYFYGGTATTTRANTTYTDIQIERGSRATDYTPYVSPNTATISFGSAGTVYSARVELISGKLVVDRVCVTPTEVIEVQSNNRWNIALTDLGVGGSESVSYMLSSHFNPMFANTAGNTYISSTKDRLIAIPTDPSLNTKALADAWLQANNPQFVYKLETPKEYQLTPAQLRSLVGANNLTSSTGEVTEVEYITNETIAWLLDLINA